MTPRLSPGASVSVWGARASAALCVLVAAALWLGPDLLRADLFTDDATQHSPGRALAAYLSGIVLQTLLVVLNAWLGDEAGIRISFIVWLFVWPMAKVSGLAPVTQGGIGVREAAQVALFAPFGVSAAAAAATGLIFEAVIITGGLLGGGLAWLMGRRRIPELPASSSRFTVRSE